MTLPDLCYTESQIRMVPSGLKTCEVTSAEEETEQVQPLGFLRVSTLTKKGTFQRDKGSLSTCTTLSHCVPSLAAGRGAQRRCHREII